MTGDSPQSKRVNLFVVGAQKAGTTALYRWLAAHPAIAAPIKEPHFFDLEERYGNGAPDAIEAYHRPYLAHAHLDYWADCTPIYLYLPHVPARLVDYNPQARIIVLLRHPADRAISQWAMEYRKEKERRSLVPSLLLEHWRRRGDTHRVYSYLHRGFYAEQLARLLNHFPRERVLILKSEHMSQAPQQVTHEICDFLGVARVNEAVIERANEGRYRAPGHMVRKALEWRYGRELQRLRTRYGISWDDDFT